MPLRKCLVYDRWIAISVLAALCIGFAILTQGCGNDSNSVVVYTALDEMYSQPIFDTFTARTGIDVSDRIRHGSLEDHRSREPAHCRTRPAPGGRVLE